MAPNNPYCWGNLGQIEDTFYRFDQAEFCYEKGLSVAKNDAERGFLHFNYAATLVQRGEWVKALPYCRKAIDYKDKAKTRCNLGLTLLALGQWKEGWPMYDSVIGFDKSRRKMQYVNEPEWDGSPGKTVVIYEEQGIGDAISFASMIPDAIRDCKKVIIDCSQKLAGIMQRSFPQADVYGTRLEDWRPKYQIDASISVGGLGKFYRPSPESCPGTPYFVPDQERVRMWKALWTKPVIGIAWSGGVEHTGAKNRIWSLDEMLPLFKSVDATWVSLQYKDASKEIAEFKARHPEIDIRQYAYGTLTPDYDDTAALVESLDMVIAMQTAVIHLSGAMGKECWCFVNKHSQWRYGPNENKTLPWAKSIRLFRNISGWPIGQAALELKDRYESRKL